MTLIAALMMTALTCMNAAYAKSYLYPPTLFSGVWSLLLFGMAVSGETFYPLSLATLTIYFGGALAFSVGGMIALAISGSQSGLTAWENHTHNRPVTDIFLNVFLAAQVLIAPLYFSRLKYLSSLANVDNLLLGIRLQTGESLQGGAGFGIFSYIIAFTTFLALVAFYENDETLIKKFRAYLYVFIAMLYQFMTAARTGSVLLLLSLTMVAFLKAEKIIYRNILVGFFVFIILFGIPAVFLNKGGSLEQSLGSNIISVAESMRDYALPSLGAFNNVVAENQGIGKGNISLRSFYAIANALGARHELESVILDYTYTPIPTNIYTIYYHYYVDYGLYGTLLIMFIIGIIIALIYQFAISLRPQAIIIYSLIAGNLLISNIGEPFMSSVSFWIQAIIVMSVIYSNSLNRLVTNCLPAKTSSRAEVVTIDSHS